MVRLDTAVSLRCLVLSLAGDGGVLMVLAEAGDGEVVLVVLVDVGLLVLGWVGGLGLVSVRVAVLGGCGYDQAVVWACRLGVLLGHGVEGVLHVYYIYSWVIPVEKSEFT